MLSPQLYAWPLCSAIDLVTSRLLPGGNVRRQSQSNPGKLRRKLLATTAQLYSGYAPQNTGYNFAKCRSSCALYCYHTQRLEPKPFSASLTGNFSVPASLSAGQSLGESVLLSGGKIGQCRSAPPLALPYQGQSLGGNLMLVRQKLYYQCRRVTTWEKQRQRHYLYLGRRLQSLGEGTWSLRIFQRINWASRW